MATYTENYSLVKPGYGDQADIDVLNRLMTDKVDALLFENRRISADEYDQEETYAVGDYAIYENVLYRCLEDTTGNFDPSKWEITNLATELSTKGGADVTKTASGNPITFDDGADAPLVKCVTQITGSQDLHGYDKPWVGGAGKNKLPLVLADIKSANTSGTWNGNTYTLNGTSTTVLVDSDGNVIGFHCVKSGSHTGTSFISISLGTFTFVNNTDYILNGCDDSASTTTYRLNITGIGNYYGGDNAIIGDGESHTIRIQYSISETTIDLYVYPMIRLSTETDPTFEPYSNICPISGYSSVGVNVAGKNLFDKTTYTFTSEKYVSLSTGNIGTNSSYACTESYIPCGNLAGQTITLNHIPGSTQPGMAFYDSSNDYISGGKGEAISVPSNAVYYRFTVPVEYASGNDVQIELGSTATAYEPYTSTTHTTTFPSAIYRGSEDVVNGEVTSEWSKKKLSDFDFTSLSTPESHIFRCDLSSIDVVYPSTIYATDAISSAYEAKAFGPISGNDHGCFAISGENYHRMIIVDHRYSTINDFVTAMGDTDFAFPLTTPTTSSVTPTNLPIKSLSGYNHIESSTGDMEIEYITEDYQPLVDLIGNAITTPILDYDNAVDLTLPDATGYTYIMPSDGVIMSTSYGSVGSTRIIYNGIEISQAYMGDSWTTQYTPFGRGTEITIKRGASEIQYISGSWIKFIPYKNGVGGSTLQTTTTSNTRSLNLTKSAVTEIPEEIKNAEYEEKPDVNEADDSAPTEVDER